jgi:hypothetical protein
MADRRFDQMGKTPGAQFATDDYSIKVAIVQRVDEVNMVADLKILSGSATERQEVPLTQALYGPRSFWGGIPEVNSLVIIGYRRTQSKAQNISILGYLPVAIRSSHRFDPISPDDPANIDGSTIAEFQDLFGTTTRFKRLNMRPGDVGGMSADGSEFVMSKDVRMMNRAGDLFELRDDDRTVVQSSIHSIETQAGVRRIAGPIRRSAFFLPDDIFAEGRTLKSDETEPPYYGRDELETAGPGPTAGEEPRFSNVGSGQVLDIFNDFTTFPPVTYSSGKRVHYPPTIRGTSVDDLDSAADAFVEDRMEMSHTSDIVQEVLEEIDGFSVDRKLPYIERVYGTLVGNTLNSTDGQRQYAEVLKPKIFEDFFSKRPGKFTLSAVDRKPTSPDLEVNTSAGAYMLRIRPPYGTSGQDGAYVHAVSKQGKTYLQIPGSKVEDTTTGESNVSAEVNLLGALKAFVGASNPERISAHLTFEGGVHLDIGRDSQGNAVTVQYHSGVKTIADGNPNQDDVAVDQDIRGTKRLNLTGRELKNIQGTRTATISGRERVDADRINYNAFSGMSLNVGEMAQMVSGKTQINYALQYQETVALGGKVMTILAGGETQTILAGAKSTTVAAGATTFTNPAGAFSVNVGTGSFGVTVGTGAITMSTGAGAMSLSAGAGAVSITSGLAMNLTATVAINLVSAQVLVGGPAAVLGVCRGTPAMPPGSPSLDIITNIPLFGSAVFRSI